MTSSEALLNNSRGGRFPTMVIVTPGIFLLMRGKILSRKYNIPSEFGTYAIIPVNTREGDAGVWSPALKYDASTPLGMTNLGTPGDSFSRSSRSWAEVAKTASCCRQARASSAFRQWVSRRYQRRLTREFACTDIRRWLWYSTLWASRIFAAPVLSL